MIARVTIEHGDKKIVEAVFDCINGGDWIAGFDDSIRVTGDLRLTGFRFVPRITKDDPELLADLRRIAGAFLKPDA